MEPMSITFSIFSGTTFAFVSDFNGNVYQCSVDNNTGAFSACAANNGGISGWAPLEIQFNTAANGLEYAYVGDWKHNLYVCPVNTATGVLSNCAANNGAMTGWSPWWITL
jgi:hypothetical protein